MTEKSSHSEIQRVLWHSRRGMLELDLALGPFAKTQYELLSAEDQAIYRKLLTSEDTDLFQWVLQASKPADPELVYIMGKILAYVQENKPSA